MKIKPIKMRPSTVLYLCAGWLGLLGASLMATATCLTHYMIVITMGTIGMIICWITRKYEQFEEAIERMMHATKIIVTGIRKKEEDDDEDN